MLYFTTYAEKKFNLLNEHGVFIRKEEVEAAVAAPDRRGKLGSCLTAEKDGVKIVYKKEQGVKRIITFYPVKNS